MAGVFGGLALRVVEVSGDGDHGAVDGFAEDRLRPSFFSSRRMKEEISGGVKTLSPSMTRMTFLLAGSMRNGKQLQFILHVGGTAAHQALHGINGALGLSQQAAARGFADDDAAVWIEADDRGAQRAAVRAGECTSAGRSARPRTRPGCWWFRDRFRRCVPLTCRSLNSLSTLATRFRIYERRFSNSFSALQDGFASAFAGVGVERGIPLLRGGFAVRHRLR